MSATLPAPTPTDKEALQREVRYRLSYRGTLELDLICRAALAHLEELDTAELAGLRDFLLHKEGDLMAWLVDGAAVPAQVQPQVTRLKGWFVAWREAQAQA